MIRDARPALSVVIPVYRSAGMLRMLVVRLVNVLDKIEFASEIVLVDDGSPDESWQVITELQERFPGRITAVQLMRNFGQHNALMCGFRHARGDLILTMDDNLQNPPEEIPKLVHAIQVGNYDLVYGRYAVKCHSRRQNFGSAILRAFHQWVFKTAVPISSFRIMRRELVESIFRYNLNFTFVDGLLSWNTNRIGQVAVEHQPRVEGRSGYSLARLVFHAMNIFTNFSLLPLQAVTLLGFVAALGGLATGGYYLARYLMAEIAVPGYASTIIAVLVLGGLQLLALGIHGEYLGRLHLNVNRKPQYTERQVLGHTRAAPTEKAESDSPAWPEGSQGSAATPRH